MTQYASSRAPRVPDVPVGAPSLRRRSIPVRDSSDLSASGAPSQAGPDDAGEPGAVREGSKSTHNADHDLVRAAQDGDSLAFQQLFERHADRAQRVAVNLVGDREDAQDIVQEAFVRVYKSLERFDFRHEFTTWLYRIVTNLGIDHLRKRRPLARGQSDEDDGGEPEPVDEWAEDPAARMEGEETAARVRACIDRLAPHFRSVMVLRELEGLPCTEIAEIVGATHVTVRWRLHRGRKLFQEEWERLERSEPSGRPDSSSGPSPANTPSPRP